MSVTLTSIRLTAKKAGACSGQYTPFCNALAVGNKLLAWQIVFGNRYWLERNGIKLPKNLEKLADGQAIRYYDDNNIIHKIQMYKNGLLHGKLVSYYDNGKLFQKKYYTNGVRNGFFETYDKRGFLKSRYLYENGKKCGISEVYHPNGNIQTRCYLKGDKRDGYFEIYNTNGHLTSKCNYRNDKLHGLQEYHPRHTNEYYIIKNYRNGLLHGDSKTYDSCGVIVSHKIYKYGVVDKVIVGEET